MPRSELIPRLAPGEVFANRFVIDYLAGSGGMGQVFRSRDLNTGAWVALKLLAEVDSEPQEARRFAREARLLSELHHPGIVSYVAHGITTLGQPYLAMEWLEGESLASQLRRGALSLCDSIELLRRCAAALQLVHRRGIVHRDLKPSNLFLRDGLVTGLTLIDFGIARLANNDSPMTRTGALVGTPQYMAPEQVRGQRDVGPGVDIYALGCVLYECLTGEMLFADNDLPALLLTILFAEPLSLERLCAVAPPQIIALLRCMLTKQPDLRLSDGAALAAALPAPTLAAGGRLERNAAGPPQPLIGREQELGLLQATLAAVREEKSARAVLMRGASGMGKTRLAHELVRRAQEPLSVYVEHGCDALLRLGDDVFCAQLTAVGADQTLLWLLDAVDDIEPRLLRSVAACLRRLEEAPLMLLVLARVEELAGFHIGRLQHIPLRALSQRESERIVRAVLGPSAAPQSVAQLIQLAAGVPRYLVELARAFLQGGQQQLDEAAAGFGLARFSDVPEVSTVCQFAPRTTRR